MLIKNKSQAISLIGKMLKDETKLEKIEPGFSVKEFLSKKDLFLSMAEKCGSPFFVFDKKQLADNFYNFGEAFSDILKKENIFYAVKSNPYPLLVEQIVKIGGGLDVSSSKELELALKCQANKILFSGPGKTLSDLDLAVLNNDKVIINVDSFSELLKLGEITNKKKASIKAGVRVCIKQIHGKWSKFGIDLSELKKFFEIAKKYKYISLCGIQCHMSFNETSKPYEKAIKIIADYLKTNFSQSQLDSIAFFDFGGGFSLNGLDGVYPYGTLQGEAIKTAFDYFGKTPEFKEKYYLNKAVILQDYAFGIKNAVNKHLNPILKNSEYFAEPGRIISQTAMHFISTVADIKKQVAITDAGTNAFGWNTFDGCYFPIINLTNPSLKEIPFEIYGSLCTPDDIWGHYCYASKIKQGDILIAPFQGAYTLTLAQNFIKPIPPVYELWQTEA